MCVWFIISLKCVPPSSTKYFFCGTPYSLAFLLPYLLISCAVFAPSPQAPICHSSATVSLWTSFLNMSSLPRISPGQLGFKYQHIPNVCLQPGPWLLYPDAYSTFPFRWLVGTSRLTMFKTELLILPSPNLPYLLSFLPQLMTISFLIIHQILELFFTFHFLSHPTYNPSAILLAVLKVFTPYVSIRNFEREIISRNRRK